MKKYEEDIIREAFKEKVVDFMIKKDDYEHIVLADPSDRGSIGSWKFDYYKPSIVKTRNYALSGTFNVALKDNPIPQGFDICAYYSQIFNNTFEEGSLDKLFKVASEFYLLLFKRKPVVSSRNFSFRMSLDDDRKSKETVFDFPMHKLSDDHKSIVLAKTPICVKGDSFYVQEGSDCKKYSIKYLSKYLHSITYKQIMRDMNIVLSLELSENFNDIDEFTVFIENYKIVIDMMYT